LTEPKIKLGDLCACLNNEIKTENSQPFLRKNRNAVAAKANCKMQFTFCKKQNAEMFGIKKLPAVLAGKERESV